MFDLVFKVGDQIESFRYEKGRFLTKSVLKDGKCSCLPFKLSKDNQCRHLVWGETMNHVTSGRIGTENESFIEMTNEPFASWRIGVKSEKGFGFVNNSYDWSEDLAVFISQLTSDEIPPTLENAVFRGGEVLYRQVVEAFDKQRNFENEEAPEKKPIKPTKVRPKGEWGKIELPSNFYVTREHWEGLLYAALCGENVLVVGPTGCGKTELVYTAAKAAGLEIEMFPMGASQNARTMLLGNTHFSKERGTWFEESRFVRAVKKEKGVILLDEVSRQSRDATNILLPLLDRQGMLALDEEEGAPVIYKGGHVCFAATANIGAEYTCADVMDAAFLNRYALILALDFPPLSEEHKILLSRCAGLESNEADQLLKIAAVQRELVSKDAFMVAISTRMLIEAGKMISQGMTMANAVKLSIINHFSEEGGSESERTKMTQILQKEDIEQCPF